ncbi:hypothetical protein EJB05_21369 [Eragrostis curvula]|uniref:Uncharacterized protein n=1 Tax=Eragrostis curvula TaxID=38414 RepID=A0A5J9V182_9POAL|nr:hypothetical protein EJB05_21369 [Eragrostis curvula]
MAPFGGRRVRWCERVTGRANWRRSDADWRIDSERPTPSLLVPSKSEAGPHISSQAHADRLPGSVNPGGPAAHATTTAPALIDRALLPLQPQYLCLQTGLFVYDSYWVFFTPVMVSVPKSFDAQIKMFSSPSHIVTSSSGHKEHKLTNCKMDKLFSPDCMLKRQYN